MKIYTKQGDAGQTALFGGERVPKDALRISAYGTVDELNSLIGVVLTLSPCEKVRPLLESLQHQLFLLGSDLATPLEKKQRIRRISSDEVAWMEAAIDELDKALTALKQFILPGGTPAAATLHMARTVCRRAERDAVACSQKESPLNEQAIIYLNRLSDLLFVLARHENHQAGRPDIPWNPDLNEGEAPDSNH
ncbi:MAG: cob(I)yrinic acid a,c-diamide adenosyltransferase [Balneolaceae bacterium]